MAKEKVNIKDKSFDGAGIKKDYRNTIIEFLLNGFEAKANNLVINAKPYSRDLSQLITLEICDDGEGINYNTRNDTFNTFLISQKGKNIFFDRANKGKGRYTFENIASSVRWTTVYTENNKNYAYTISISKTERDYCEYTDPVETQAQTGTKVEFLGIQGLRIDDLESEDFKIAIVKFFAKYLYLYRAKHIFLNQEEIHYSLIIDEELSESFSKTIGDSIFNFNFIKWLDGSNQKSFVYYVDEKYIERDKEHTKCNNNAIKFYHSLFIDSTYFNNFIKTETGEPLLPPYINQTDKTFRELETFVFKYVKEMLKKYIQAEVPGIVQSYVDQGLFPVFDEDNPLDNVQKEDLQAVVIEVFCIQPNLFYKSKKEHKQAIIGCLNLILKTDERDNIITILDGIQKLTSEERQQLADTLKKYEGGSVVKLINTITSRQEIIKKLKTLIYDNDSFTNERNHIQKIIEQNYWLFGEEYSLVSADEKIETVLLKYLKKLDKENKTCVKFEDPIYRDKRPDIFICGNHNVVNSSQCLQENIIVELKAPYVKLDISVYRQIEDYMIAISNDPNFTSEYKVWKFICVCKELKKEIYSKRNALKQFNKKGLAGIQDNFEIYAFTWAEIFDIFDLKHSHLYGKLIKKQTEKNEETPSKELADALTSEIHKLSSFAK